MGEDIRDLEQTSRKTISGGVNSDGVPQGRNTYTEPLLLPPAAHLQPSPVQEQMHTFVLSRTASSKLYAYVRHVTRLH